jgi:hypothetical protein
MLERHRFILPFTKEGRCSKNIDGIIPGVLCSPSNGKVKAGCVFK